MGENGFGHPYNCWTLYMCGSLVLPVRTLVGRKTCCFFGECLHSPQSQVMSEGTDCIHPSLQSKVFVKWMSQRRETNVLGVWPLGLQEIILLKGCCHSHGSGPPSPEDTRGCLLFAHLKDSLVGKGTTLSVIHLYPSSILLLEWNQKMWGKTNCQDSFDRKSTLIHQFFVIYIESNTIRGEGWEKREEPKPELSRSMGQLSAQGRGSAIPVDTHTPWNKTVIQE